LNLNYGEFIYEVYKTRVFDQYYYQRKPIGQLDMEKTAEEIEHHLQKIEL